MKKDENMGKLYVFFILIFLFFSCSLFEVKNPDVRSYFPLAVGNRWEYDLIRLYVDGNLWYDDTYPVKVEVSRKVTIVNKEFFECNGVFIDDDGDTSPLCCFYLRLEDEFLLAIKDSCKWPEESLPTIDTLLHGPNLDTYKKWVILIDTWEKYAYYSADYEGKEEVKLPSGIYNSLKVDYIFSHSTDDEPSNYFYWFGWDWCPYSRPTFFYGKGVGMVKAEVIQDDEGSLEVVQLILKNYYVKK